MPEQLKIIIDADVNKAIAGVQNLSKVITSDFVKATNSASIAASNLSKDVANSVQKINASLSGLKVTSLDVSVNTSSVDASIKSIQSKFAQLVDPELNVLADTVQAEAKIKDLLSELSSLKGSEIFIRANDVQALKVINEVESELKSLVGKQIDLSIRADLGKLEELRAKLSSLKVTPIDVGVNTSLIDASIKNIQSKFAALLDPKINVLADTAQAEIKIKELISDLSALKGSEIFIRANDTQALQKINEIEKELNTLVGKQINLNVTTDLTKLNELKTKLDTLKVSPVNISVTTAEVDASIKTIQAKFAAIVDPQVNILANTELAEAKIKELLTDLSTLKGSEVFIRADNSQALKVINDVEVELNTLLDKQIKLNVITTEANLKLASLEKELLDLQNLSIQPNISSTQLALFEKNIIRVKAEIAELKGQAIIVPMNILPPKIPPIPPIPPIKGPEIIIPPIKIPPVPPIKIPPIPPIPINGLNAFHAALGKNTLAIDQLQRKQSGLNNFYGGLIQNNNKAAASFKKAETNVSGFSKAFGGLKSLANIIPGLGLGGLIGLAATAVNALTEGFFEAAFGASKLDKAIGAASDSVDKNAASVVLMVRALQSGTLSSTEFKKVKAELIAQAPEFQKSFDGDKISIEASEAALQNYIKQLTTTVRVTAALAVVNDTLAKSIKAIVTGGELSFGQKLLSIFKAGGNLGESLGNAAKQGIENVNDALESFKPENITKLIDDTFKKLGITFKDFGKTIDPNALEALLAKQKAAFEKFQNEVISKAQQFKKQFGDAFVLPELEVSFFTSKEQVFKNALKVLSDVKSDLSKAAALTKLQIKLPVLATTETKVNTDDLKKFLRDEIKKDQVREIKIRVPVITDLEIKISESVLAGSLSKEIEASKNLIDNFFKSVQLERKIPIEVTPDLTLAKGSLDKIDQKLNLRQQFSILGDFGLKEFNKIDFSNINAGIAEATKRLQGMMDIANTLNQAIGQGLSNAFNSVFDAVLEGKSVFKALGNAIKELVVSTIKAIAQMLILRLVTNAIFGGAGGAIPLPRLGGGIGGQANLGFGGIGSSAFNNVLQVQGTSTINGNDIVISFNRASNSSGRFG